MAFQPQAKDFTLSPYTGMTRDSWVQAGKYLLEGIFCHVKHFTDPVIVKRTETQITYPHKNGSSQQLDAERRAEIFEGLTRSFFIAAPLIHDNRNVAAGGYNLRDYYRAQVLKACMPTDENYVGSYDFLKKLTGQEGGSPCFQQTVETCALVIGLWASKEEIWDSYTKAEKDVIADFLLSFAHAPTVPQNWRLFNMLDMAFLYSEGYSIDKEIMLDHATSILAYYAGQGWYRDGHSFDYYSAWAFQFYAPLWCKWYGYENMPALAKRFEENSNELMKTYPDFFDADGWTNMWGRSNIYRFAAVSAFEGNMLLKNPTVDYGLARRIASGSLLQFLSREDFLTDGVPTLGFYRQFSPLVQGYSCAESPFWMGKAFLCLHLDKEHPFWTAREHNGTWESLKGKAVKSTVLNGPALAFSNHGANGTTCLRTGKIVKNRGDRHGMWNYSKLVYSTKYPWESGATEQAEAQQYVLKTEGKYERANVTLWHGEKKGVLYRRQFFDYDLTRESCWVQAVNLADFPVPYGIFRADKLRLYRRPVEITLGSFGFPDNGTQIERRQKGKYQAIVLKGYDAMGREKQLAMTVFDGWDELEILKSRGTNPDSEHSIVICAKGTRIKDYGYEQYLLLSQTLTKESHEDFTNDELFPLLRVDSEDAMNAFGKTVLKFVDGSEKEIDFDGIESELSL